VIKTVVMKENVNFPNVLLDISDNTHMLCCEIIEVLIVDQI